MQYTSKLNLLDTEIAIKFVKDEFEKELAKSLNLTRVSAPLFVAPETGLNDNLNGVERAVKFDVLTLHKDVEIVQSLAKWKRNALAKYGFKAGSGLYTDMNAIRRDETLDALHSVYVDQWDWEKIILREERTYGYLKKTVKSVYKAIKKTARLPFFGKRAGRMPDGLVRLASFFYGAAFICRSSGAPAVRSCA